MSNSYVYNRQIKDAQKVVTKAAPADGASNQSPTIDLGAGPFKPEEMEVEISFPAIAALADTKTLTITLQDSADDSSYADTDPVISTSVVGVSTNGSAAKKVRFRLPASTRRYIQFTQTAVASAGTITGSTITYSLLF